MKYYRMSYDEIVNRRAYKTILLLNASIPSYNTKGDEKKEIRHANEVFENL